MLSCVRLDSRYSHRERNRSMDDSVIMHVLYKESPFFSRSRELHFQQLYEDRGRILDQNLYEQKCARDREGPKPSLSDIDVVRIRAIEFEIEAIDYDEKEVLRSPAFVVDSLARSGLYDRELELLIVTAHDIQVYNPGLREEMACQLHRHAIKIRDNISAYGEWPRPQSRRSLVDPLIDRTDCPILWAAIRRFGSLVTVDKATWLLDFMRDEDVRSTKQVALQVLFWMRTTRPAVHAVWDHDVVEKIRSRVSEIAASRLFAEQIPSEIALSMCAMVAAASFGERSFADAFMRLYPDENGYVQRHLAKELSSCTF